MLAVAAVIYDGAPPPPELLRAWDYKAWGINLLELPPGEVRRISQAYNVHAHLSAYRRAGSQNRGAKWTQDNPEAYELVTWVLAERARVRMEDEINAG